MNQYSLFSTRKQFIMEMNEEDCNRHNNNTIPESVYESINQGEAVFCSLYNRKQIESLLVI